MRDLEAGVETEESLLVQMAAPRLERLGIAVPGGADAGAGHRLYALMSDGTPAAHSRYRAALRRIASFAGAAEHATTR